jgi:hypothetical protein
MSGETFGEEIDRLEAEFNAKITDAHRKEAKDIWDMFSALMESGMAYFEYIEPLLTRAEALFKSIEGENGKLAQYVKLAKLKGADGCLSELDDVRCLLHLVFEPESGGGLTRYEIWKDEKETT